TVTSAGAVIPILTRLPWICAIVTTMESLIMICSPIFLVRTSMGHLLHEYMVSNNFRKRLHFLCRSDVSAPKIETRQNGVSRNSVPVRKCIKLDHHRRKRAQLAAEPLPAWPLPHCPGVWQP